MTPERTRSVLFGLALVVVLALGSRQKVWKPQAASFPVTSIPSS